MHWLQSIVLGIIQGLTEFIPVSSSAHLDIIPKLLGWGDPGASFTAVIQLGTTFAVIAYFWSDLIKIAKGILKKNPAALQLGLAIVLGTIPAAVAGLALEKKIDNEFRDLRYTATALIVMGLVLLAAEHFTKKERKLKDLTLLDGLVVGLFQCLALLPGCSRSGSTLTGAYCRKLTRESAARFSFLLSLPIIVASGLYKAFKVVKAHEGFGSGLTTTDAIVANIVGGVVGYFCIAFLMKFLKTNSPLVFVIYRVVIGLALFALIATGKLAAK